MKWNSQPKIAAKIMLAAMLLICALSFAQTLDPTQPLWGFHWSEISFLLGAVAPFLNSLIAKSTWTSRHKEYLISGICLIATVGVGIYLKALTGAMFGGDQIIATFVIIVGMSQVVYKAAKPFFKSLTANVGNGAGKTANPT